MIVNILKGIRRLEVKRKRAMIEAMMDFVEEVVGKPYNRNLVQLVKGQFGNNDKDNLNQYFCSQLVAAAYQRMVQYSFGFFLKSILMLIIHSSIH